MGRAFKDGVPGRRDGRRRGRGALNSSGEDWEKGDLCIISEEQAGPAASSSTLLKPTRCAKSPISDSADLLNTNASGFRLYADLPRLQGR